MKKYVLILSAFVVLASVSSCVKKCKEAGTGGSLTLVGKLQHHGNTIINHIGYPDTVFVKFNTKDLPGTNPSSYDTYFVGDVGEDHVHMENLKCGDYYLYAVGMDSTGPYRVSGGIPFSTEQESGEIVLYQPVT